MNWLSTMNTFQPDVSSCRSDKRVRPSSDARQAHDDHYGLPTAYDVGGTSLIQTGTIGSGLGAGTSLPSVSRTVSGTDWVTQSVSITSMNMRSAWPTSSIPVRLVLSQNRALDASDVNVGDFTLGNLQAGAIYAYS